MMLETKHRLKCGIFACFMAGLFTFGVLLAGCEFEGFPWFNLLGAIMLGTFGLIGNAILK